MHSQLYFAYGSNMDCTQMAARCPGAHQRGIATLPRHRFLINSRGVATILPDPTTSVHGLLWSLSPSNVEALDRYEGVATGAYLKTYLHVEYQQGLAQALVYVATDSRPGSPRPGYLERILHAARVLGLQPDYVAALETSAH